MTAGALLAAGAALIALPAASGAARADAVSVERRVYLMGTRATLAALAADRAQGLSLLERALGVLEAAEAELSTWREESALSAINRQPVGSEGRAPEAVCGLLEELRRWRRATGGAFDPAIGSLIGAWGLREGGRVPSREELARARRDAGLEHLAVRGEPCRVTRLRGVRLDAGGFGKGEALDRVAALEPPPGAAWMVDLGGQVAVGGGGGPWPVALAHPRRRDEAALELQLESGSLATSAGALRDVESGGWRIGHILDPRAGRPVSRSASVTVWHPRALVADVLSTALYVMGIDEALAWAEARDVAACVLLPEPEGRGVAIRATRAFRRRFLSD